MDSFKRMIQQQKDLQKTFERLMPDMSYMESIKRNFEMMESITKPHQDLIAQMSQFDHLSSSPVLKQMEELSNTVCKMLPKYSTDFLLSSSMLEAYRHSIIVVPDVFMEFEARNQMLIDATKRLSSAFENISIDIIKPPIIFDQLPDYLIAPVISASSHFQVLKNLHYIETSIEDETKEDYFEAVNDNCSTAEKKIKAANKNWLVLLNGAEQSFLSRNPDKVRHTITSLRELITQILHTSAPDNELKQKYTEPKYYYDGKPTRRTRIKYILFNKYSNSSLIDIIDKDIATILEMFNLFQEGTHKVVSSLSDDELKFILKRTILMIEQLL